MAFKLKSGNKVSFKNMGSSPVKEEKKETPSYKSKAQIKDEYKTSKLTARGEESEGGAEITENERRAMQNARQSDLLTHYKGLEEAGKGEKGFSWKKAGMALLEGKGLMGAAGAGMGAGRDKSAIMQDKITKTEGKNTRADIKKEREAKAKAAKAKAREDKANARAAKAGMDTSSNVQVKASKNFLKEEEV